MRLYKIRDNATGLYSTGGRWPGWNKNGKSWTNVGGVKASLNLHKNIPATWEVVIFDVFEIGAVAAHDAKTLKNK